jgi:hypothetical protein
MSTLTGMLYALALLLVAVLAVALGLLGAPPWVWIATVGPFTALAFWFLVDRNKPGCD